jgi:anthranilate synthase component 2
MILLIDNFDSFTYNLLHYIEELGQKVLVKRNNEVSVDEALALNPSKIVISPGPCTPNEAGICKDLIKAAAGKIPVFGVCLGHQAITEVFGGRVVRAEVPVHGKVSKIFHDGKSVFKGLPSPFNATRYHSLISEVASFPGELEVTAKTEDGIIMALQHKKYNVHGVQFHPESIASEHGHALIKNFLEL